MVKLDIWQDGLKELRQDGLRRAKALIDKYGYSLDEDKMDINDSYEFMFVKSYVDEIDKEYQISSNEMYGRSNFSIHGGAFLGSAGCIDVAERAGEFFEKFGNNGRDMILNVHYPEEKIR